MIILSNIPVKNHFDLFNDFAKFAFNQNDSCDIVIKKVSNSNNNFNINNGNAT